METKVFVSVASSLFSEGGGGDVCMLNAKMHLQILAKSSKNMGSKRAVVLLAGSAGHREGTLY